MQKPDVAAGEPKPTKRSVLGFLFKPQLGPALTPMRDTTRIFVHLVAGVFSLYGLFPKTHPALRDETLRLPLQEVIGTAWNSLEFTRDGLSKVIVFFAVVGMMAFSALMAVSAVFGLFIGHAHAAALDASAFNPESKDVAQAWLDYLFNSPSGAAFPTASDPYFRAASACKRR